MLVMCIRSGNKTAKDVVIKVNMVGRQRWVMVGSEQQRLHGTEVSAAASCLSPGPVWVRFKP